ncbi:MAG: preprotein translocase subunit YajC [Clostridiales bacterium]
MTENPIALMLTYVVVIVGFMFVLIILPQKRREKKARQMIDSLKVGDAVTTIGGVYGKIINIKDDEITIETGLKKSQLVFKSWSIKDVKQLKEA